MGSGIIDTQPEVLPLAAVSCAAEMLPVPSTASVVSVLWGCPSGWSGCHGYEGDTGGGERKKKERERREGWKEGGVEGGR